MKGELEMVLRSPTGYEGTHRAMVTPEQWGDLIRVAEGSGTLRAQQLQTMLQQAVNVVAAFEEGNQRVDFAVLLADIRGVLEATP